MAKTEFQRQLEALGFIAIPKKSNSNLVQIKRFDTGSSKTAALRDKTRTLTVKEEHEKAEMIIRNMYKNPKNWEATTFRNAIKCVTGQPQILTYNEAASIIHRWKLFESRIYRLDFSLAILLLRGKWIAPKRKPILDTKQTDARCERRDINGNYVERVIFRG
ncbi:hypothetical protein [Photobacterium carnosum]|uniref:Uncharacterized protein n=1 Tax=Photobacterium carnosum TaxID=2023717 RepID=A0A2N4UNN2_9GAMM|nr:hypothetical protein [Photobacterium carnosum]MCD9554730.1 hypothetical protein [Photobacterium carnosum]PLC56620.1 hypothetical protein CIK00_17520 [Photobacterium carnosum]